MVFFGTPYNILSGKKLNSVRVTARLVGASPLIYFSLLLCETRIFFFLSHIRFFISSSSISYLTQNLCNSNCANTKENGWIHVFLRYRRSRRFSGRIDGTHKDFAYVSLHTILPYRVLSFSHPALCMQAARGTPLRPPQLFSLSLSLSLSLFLSLSLHVIRIRV